MDLEKIEELIDLMQRSGVTQLSLELPDYKVSITRGGEHPAPAQAAVAAVQPAGRLPESASVSLRAEAVTVTSPVVGQFHSAENLKGQRAVMVGDRVTRGAPLATIEAMKVPNEVRSPVDGVVSAVLVEDGAAVEYGQPLFVVEPEEGGEPDEGETPVGLA